LILFSASSGNGRCSALASSKGARIQTSRSSSDVKITGIALGWIAQSEIAHPNESITRAKVLSIVYLNRVLSSAMSLQGPRAI
jgi:hypothetical protein